MRLPRLRAWVFVGLTAAACREPTQITIYITTNVPCADLDGVNIIVGPASSLDSRARSASTSACDPSGKVGSIVVVPSGTSDDPVAIAVIAGTRNADPLLTTAADDCTAANYAHCIVARRSLRFIPHTPLVLPIELVSSCIGVPCSADASGPRTCVNGACVSATIDPSRCIDPGGCSLAQDGGAPPADGGPDGGPAGHVRELALGAGHSCALLNDGTVVCWGDNSRGQLGVGKSDLVRSPTPVPLPGLEGVAHLSALSEANTCALMNDGTVRCWGDACCGQLGPNYNTTQYAPVLVSGISGVTSLSVGRALVCAAGGTPGPAACWGDIGPGLGTPLLVPGVTGTVQAVRAADKSAFFHMKDGSLLAYGRNINGVLGLNDQNANRITTSAISVALQNVTSVAVGVAFVIATVENGPVYVWGESSSYQLGLNQSANVFAPTAAPALAGLHGFVGGDQHACALDGQEAVVCWGDGSYGQLGPSVTTKTPSPTKIGLTAVKLFSGWDHTCAIDAAGAVFCWGLNDKGQVGDGTTTNVATPVKLSL